MNISLHPDVLEHINSFAEKETEKINRTILYIQEYGINNLMRSKHCEYIGKYGLYEIKRKLDKQEFRAFAVITQDTCHIINSFTKKSQKIKQKEIKKALARKKYL